MIVPVKTDDIVVRNGVRYVVRSVQLTQEGPILEVLLINENEPLIIHASEVNLANESETTRRAKSAGLLEKLKLTRSETQ